MLDVVAWVDRLPTSLVLVQGAVDATRLFDESKSCGEGEGLSSGDPVNLLSG